MTNDVQLIQKLRRVRLIALDVDGVLTDGGIYMQGPLETKRFDVKDGAGIVVAQKAGLTVALITGRSSEAVARRAEELGIKEVHQAVKDKLYVLKAVATRSHIKREEVLYMGDDLPDLACLNWSGVSVAPADADADVASRAMLVTKAPGGRGAVREMIEYVLKAQDLWTTVIHAYTGDSDQRPSGEHRRSV